VSDQQVELRGMVSRRTIDVLDAVSAAQRVSRIELVEAILNQYADRKVHEATVVLRVMRGDGRRTELPGTKTE